jgi:hypothetical protein
MAGSTREVSRVLHLLLAQARRIEIAEQLAGLAAAACQQVPEGDNHLQHDNRNSVLMKRAPSRWSVRESIEEECLKEGPRRGEARKRVSQDEADSTTMDTKLGITTVAESHGGASALERQHLCWECQCLALLAYPTTGTGSH